LKSRRALLSVSDKTGLVEFARGLVELGFELVSTGGTKAHLLAAGVPVIGVSTVTGAREILDGRVKSLHPRIHGGILARRDQAAHLAELETEGIREIDLVAVNLYPFGRTVEDPDVLEAVALENIDIGGPAMIRAAAKNHPSVWVVVTPADYGEVLAAAGRGDGASEESARLRRRLAQRAFAHTAAYDAVIATWLARRAEDGAPRASSLSLGLHLEQSLRYGENPHQTGYVFRDLAGPGVLGGVRQLQGKELSWNNLLDADAARKLVALFDEPAVVIVKHNNPCGVGRGADLEEAYRRALATDPVSAFGSIVAVNRPLDEAVVEAMADLFIEVLIAPAVAEPAAERLAAKKNLRLLVAPPYEPQPSDLELRPIDGGFVAQPADGFGEDVAGWTCPTRRAPTADERRALEFAWKVARYVKSNAIVVTNGDQTVGIGAGQMSRVDSCRLAISKAQLPVRGGVAASDAFFPFRDGLDVLLEAGITAIVQPGGSKRDDEVVAAADERDVAMLFTGTRHFRH
jgi:phosphoribosylaminoimidazolecarboxamide formyltransferase / IMP cyclohydrolase